MWDGLTRSGDDFDERGAFSHLRATSLTGYRLSYGQWLQHLVDEGIDIAGEASDARATLARLRRYHEAISCHSPRSMATRFAQLHRVLSNAFPNGDWRRLRNAANALNRQAKDAGRARDLDKLPPSDMLLEAGLAAIATVREKASLTPRDALLWRNGLLVAMLACHALRRRTLSALELGTTLRRDEDGYMIWMTADDMKAGQAFEFRVSPLLTAEIDAYLERARPVFPNGSDPEHGPLWLTSKGRALRPQMITHAVTDVTERFAARRTTPHAFRHAAMTTMANAEGFDTRHGQSFLGHRRPDVAETHYNLASQLDAGRDYARLLTRLARHPARRR